MSNIHAQFTGADLKVMQGWFGSPQDPDIWPNQADIETTDSRYNDWYFSQPEGLRWMSPDPE